MGNILKPVTFKIGLCSSSYVLKPSLRLGRALRVLELQEPIYRSLHDAIHLAELLFALDPSQVPVKNLKA